MQAAAGVIGLARKLGLLVHEDEVVRCGLARPPDLRGGAAIAVADVVGEFIAEADVADVQVIEVPVVERWPVAQQAGLRVAGARRAHDRDALLAHVVGAVQQAIEIGPQRSIGQLADAVGVEEQPVGVAGACVQPLEVALSEEAEQRAKLLAHLRERGSAVDALGILVVIGVEARVRRPGAAGVRARVAVAGRVAQEVHRERRDHVERAETRVIVEVDAVRVA